MVSRTQQWHITLKALLASRQFAPHAFSTRILPPLVKRLRKRFPEIEIEIVELTDEDTRRALKDGFVDFATLAGWEDLELEYIPLAEDRLVGLLPERHPMAKMTSVTPQDLAEEEFIMTKGGSEPLVRDWFRSKSAEPNVRHTALQLTSILAMVRAGFGLSVVAEMAVPESHPQVSIVPLEPVQVREIYLCARKGSFSSHAAKQVWRFLA